MMSAVSFAASVSDAGGAASVGLGVEAHVCPAALAEPPVLASAGALGGVAPGGKGTVARGAGGGDADGAVFGRDNPWIRAIMARAGATRRPLATSSRIRANSSRLAWTTSNKSLFAATEP